MAPRRSRKKRRETRRTHKKTASVAASLARPLESHLQTAKPPASAPEIPEPPRRTDRALLGRLFADVTPLEGGKRRLAASPAPVGELGLSARRRLAESEAVRFIVERADERWSGYRATESEGVLDVFRRRAWLPQQRVDLHGWRAADVERDLGDILRSAVRRGFGRILLIHGRGTHSPTGQGVLGEVVVEVLTRPPVSTLVRAFQTAPVRLGGSGALCVELRAGAAKAR